MLLSIVIPVYNESESLPELLRVLGQALSQADFQYEVVFIDDGSRDDSLQLLRNAALADSRVKVLAFGRNFGHQVAITAGLDFAAGDAVVVMDADLQDPPDLLPKMVELYRQGFDIVSAQRIARRGDSIFKRATASLFYWIMRRMVDPRLVPEVGDFRLFSRAAVLTIRRFGERHRFMRGLVAWIGMKEAILPFTRQPRAAGSTKYPFFKMVRFAWTAISSSSALPLQLSLRIGAVLTLAGLLYLAYSVYSAIVAKSVVPGWTSLVCLQIIFSGAMLMAVGMLGDYVAKIYEEAKERPLYVVIDAFNVRPETADASRGILLPAREESVRRKVSTSGRY